MLDDLFDGEKEALVIDNSLTTYTHQLFTPEYLNEYSTLSIFDPYKNAIKENSLLDTKLSGDLLLLHLLAICLKILNCGSVHVWNTG